MDDLSDLTAGICLMVAAMAMSFAFALLLFNFPIVVGALLALGVLGCFLHQGYRLYRRISGSYGKDS